MEAGIKVAEDTDWNEQGAATNGQEITGILASYKGTLMGKEK